MQRKSEGSRDGAVARSLLHINLVAAVAFMLPEASTARTMATGATAS